MEPLTQAAREKILWQGRPAPRCYTFQYWKQALLGSLLFLTSSFWLMFALELTRDAQPFWLALLPLPLIVGSFVFGPWQILLARWRWPRIFYRLTETQLLFSVGKPVPLARIIDIKMMKQGANLASLRVTVEDSSPAIIHCIEQPHQLLRLLNEHCPQLKV